MLQVETQFFSSECDSYMRAIGGGSVEHGRMWAPWESRETHIQMEREIEKERAGFREKYQVCFTLLKLPLLYYTIMNY